LDTDEHNARIYAAHRDEPLADVLAGARQAHRELLGLVEALPDSALAGTHWFAASDGPLWESIAGNTYEHYREHALRR
ncbi:MAG TPA: ClbS/DfsB family four-helix bundle protein, partial [Thermomicrobiales bacterium]|nr:ClbS/DfsB family four-helix bundle protein [Thermomicrobiales bacterium]